jgi:hypothetical protein
MVQRQEWVDVPMAFVGRVIGKKGEQIRKICDESGAVRGTEIPCFPMCFCYGMLWKMAKNGHVHIQILEMRFLRGNSSGQL